MMKPVIFSLLIILFYSCSTDYDGIKPEEDIILKFGSNDTLLLNTAVSISWTGTIGNSNDLNYFYCVTTDTSVTSFTALTSLSSDKWISTKSTSAEFYFPATAFNSEEVFYKDTIVQDTIPVKAVWSKLFLYAENSVKIKTQVLQRVFLRYNTKPVLTKLESDVIGLKNETGGRTYRETNIKVLILHSSNPNYVPVDFTWTSTDGDINHELKYQWKLSEITETGSVIVETSDWITETTVYINDEIYDHNPNSRYRFDVVVRDDAMEICEQTFSLGFLAFSPTYDKGILFIDDTDPILYPPPPDDYYIMGNPDPVLTSAFYEEVLRYSGYKPEEESADSLSLYRIKRFENDIEFVYWEYFWGDDDGNPATPDVIVDSSDAYRGVYKPDLKELVQYRLVVIASDDRSNMNGVDFLDQPPYFGYDRLLSQYLDLGGKIFIMGPSVLMGKIYNQLPVYEYNDPFTYIFDGSVEFGQGLGAGAETFFNEYFGIYSVTFPEQKTHFVKNSLDPAFTPDDYKYTDNYDFIGATVEDYITDTRIKPLRINGDNVNGAWFNRTLGPMMFEFALKDSGTVFTGVPTFSIFKGEPIYNYQSIYDLPVTDYKDSLAFEYSGTDTLFHKLYWEDLLTGETGPVLHRDGTVASRYMADDDVYRTAFFSLPTYFLDNSEDQVSDMFMAMIEWFDLSKDPTESRKKK